MSTANMVERLEHEWHELSELHKLILFIRVIRDYLFVPNQRTNLYRSCIVKPNSRYKEDFNYRTPKLFGTNHLGISRKHSTFFSV